MQLQLDNKWQKCSMQAPKKQSEKLQVAIEVTYTLYGNLLRMSNYMFVKACLGKPKYRLLRKLV